MMRLTLETEKRDCDPKGTTMIHLLIGDERYRNIWTLEDTEITDNVMDAIKNAVKVGRDLARAEASEAMMALTFY
jgi:hypothetical protein